MCRLDVRSNIWANPRATKSYYYKVRGTSKGSEKTQIQPVRTVHVAYDAEAKTGILLVSTVVAQLDRLVLIVSATSWLHMVAVRRTDDDRIRRGLSTGERLSKSAISWIAGRLVESRYPKQHALKGCRLEESQPAEV